jgi:cellulose synthase/poly-beta-1,6-N-acetylglucosamine synthase-like glycosyltransferase
MLDYSIAIISLIIGSISLIYYALNSYMAIKYKDKTQIPQKNTTKDVTIVVPVYNEDKALFEKCISQIKKQKVQFLVVSDALKEPYSSITLKNGGKFIFQSKRGGKRKALAIAMKHVNTKYVLFVDSDTIIPDNTTISMLSNFNQNVGGVGTAISIILDESWISYCSEFFQKAKELVFKAMASTGNIFVISGRCAMYRTEAIKPFILSSAFQQNLIMGKRGLIAEDMHITSHILKLGYKAVIDYNVTVLTEAQSSMGDMFRQLVRWARGGYLYFFRDIYDGSYIQKGALYSFEMFYIYLLPLALVITALVRLRLMLSLGLTNILVTSSAGLGALAFLPELSLSISIIGIAIFAIALSRSISKKKLKTLAAGGVMSIIMLLASLYALLTVWNQGEWLTR